jgi:cysteine-rich repeat protein
MTKLLLVLVAASGCGEVLKEQMDAANSVCGNSMVEVTEQCDDGNTVDGDDCTAMCKNAKCGDGIVNTAGLTPEQCDDGNTEDGDDCTNACKTAMCGDGIVRTSGSTTEACDDANAVDGDDCTNACAAARCGDSIVHSTGTGTEVCDPPGPNCTATCKVACIHGIAGSQAQAGPYSQYGFCWYLGADGRTCDSVCASLAGANLANSAAAQWADACQGAAAGDISQFFFANGNAGGWLNTGGTSYHTLGYGYRNQQYYGKCASGTTMGNGSFPADTIDSTTRSLVCPCFVPAP